MTKYVAFLRGINVLGHNILNMEELRQQINSLGFKNVSTYKQSGNIIFEISDKKIPLIKKYKENSIDYLGAMLKYS